MKLTHVKIGGRSFALAFTLNVMADLEDAVPEFDIAKLTEYVKTPKGLLTILTIMAKQGEALENRVLDVDSSWFGAHIRPGPANLMGLQSAIMEAMYEGMRMETEDDDGDSDVVLEEIKKKEKKDG